LYFVIAKHSHTKLLKLPIYEPQEARRIKIVEAGEVQKVGK
jgi:hypothetical protein